jgi:hypothetical protein
MTDNKLSIFRPIELSGTYLVDFASMILKDGRQNAKAKIKEPQATITRCLFAVALGSDLIIRIKSRRISIRSRLTVTTSGDSDRE